MAAEIWAAYSVRDHLRPNAFLADVVMYDHLVVPVPPPGDTTQGARWKDENSWKPERQRELSRRARTGRDTGSLDSGAASRLGEFLLTEQISDRRRLQQELGLRIDRRSLI